MSGDMFKKLVKQRQKSQPETPSSEQPVEATQPKDIPPTPIPKPEVKKRGRPATGKRSDPDWIGRTYYIRKETDLDVEGELLQLKREGIELDKSELVDALLAAWMQWRQGENIDLQIAEISPRRKADNN